ncbi:MAG: hypothetical protein WD995_10370 [Gemmatimonadota bacterium]
MMRIRFATVLPLASAFAFLTACGSEQGRAEPDLEGPAGAVAALGVQNVAVPLPNLITAARPSEEQMDALVSMGYDRFISLQLPEEAGAGWEEGRFAGAGGRFERIPVAGPDDLTRENVERLAAVLEEAGAEETVLYCASSNRVGALLALKAYWLDGADADEALTLGRAAGLTGLEPNVRRLLEMDR